MANVHPFYVSPAAPELSTVGNACGATWLIDDTAKESRFDCKTLAVRTGAMADFHWFFEKAAPGPVTVFEHVQQLLPAGGAA